LCISLRDLPDPGAKNPGAPQEVQRVLAADLPGLQVVGETTGETARILRLTEGRIRQMLLARELEDTLDRVSDRWRIPQAAVHARKEERAPQELARSASDPPEWIEKVGELRQELGRMQGRLELTKVAASPRLGSSYSERGSVPTAWRPSYGTNAQKDSGRGCSADSPRPDRRKGVYTQSCGCGH
jgi:hypothetical protein